MGRAAKDAIGVARRQVAELIGARGDAEQEIVFTACATESNNLAIICTVLDSPPARRHIVISAVEHVAVTLVCEVRPLV